MTSAKPSEDTRPAHQARSRRAQEKLLAATDRLLESRDFSQISIKEIAAEAGVAIGTVYQRFANKDALLRALVARFEAEMLSQLEHLDPPQESPTLFNCLLALTERGWMMLAAKPNLYRAIYIAVRVTPDILAEDWSAMEDAALEQLNQLLAPFKADIRHEEPISAIRFTTYTLGTLFIERILFEQTAPDWVRAQSQKSMTREAARMLHAYLTNPAAP